MNKHIKPFSSKEYAKVNKKFFWFTDGLNPKSEKKFSRRYNRRIEKQNLKEEIKC